MKSPHCKAQREKNWVTPRHPEATQPTELITGAALILFCSSALTGLWRPSRALQLPLGPMTSGGMEKMSMKTWDNGGKMWENGGKYTLYLYIYTHIITIPNHNFYGWYRPFSNGLYNNYCCFNHIIYRSICLSVYLSICPSIYLII